MAELIAFQNNPEYRRAVKTAALIARQNDPEYQRVLADKKKVMEKLRTKGLAMGLTDAEVTEIMIENGGAAP
jgi:hypothetical protein